MSRQLDEEMLSQIGELRNGLKQANKKQEQLQEILEKVCGMPWYPATFLGRADTPRGAMALVQHGNSSRLVGFGDEVNPEELVVGHDVFLNGEMNFIIAPSSQGPRTCGETALYERTLEDGRLALKWRDELILVTPSGDLEDVKLEGGDPIRFNRDAWIAQEKIQRNEGHEFLLDDVPTLSPDMIGGQDGALRELLAVLSMILVQPEKAAQYRLDGNNTILLEGPPGNGKTLLAQVAASEIRRISGKRCRFAVVKPAEWESPWVGETQRNIREFFRALGEAARDGLAVCFMDEVEAVGRIRGAGAGNMHSDKFLGTFLTELNGFEERRNVAIISATNRKDLLDAALLERLSDLEIRVARPTLDGARAILGIHLPASIPFRSNGTTAVESREEWIEAVASRLYSPNAKAELTKIRFSDGSERVIHARELASGRFLAQLCKSACRSAYLRDVEQGDLGLCWDDFESALCRSMDKLRSSLTVHNAKNYLSDLPQDMDVVSVEPIEPMVRRPHRILTPSAAT
jgi:proteasome-associated ATPase